MTHVGKDTQNFAHSEEIAPLNVWTKERAPVAGDVTPEQPLHRWDSTGVLLVDGT